MSAPIIYSGAADVGISPANPGLFGSLGEIQAVTFHHSAGPRARTKAAAQALHRAFQRDHISQGWGDIGYHFSIDDLGRVYKLRDIQYKGAHTGGHNTGNVGVMLHGNYDLDVLTDAQADTLRWLFRGGLQTLTGQAESSFALVRGHQEWPGPTNQTACPGRSLMAHVRFLRNTEL